MDNSRLRFAILPMLFSMMVTAKFAPPSWLDAVALGLTAFIVVIGGLMGVATWRWAKSQNA